MGEGSEDSLGADGAFVCMAPFVHLHHSTLGGFTPCCEIPFPLADRPGATPSTHWNSPEMAAFRKAMLDNEPLDACSRCYEKDATGVFSLRRYFNEKYRHEAWRLAATRADGTLPDEARPIDLDLRVSNLCNFRCRSCWHGASSRWFADAKALGTTCGPSAIITSGSDREATLAEVLERLDELSAIYFAGGEPLLMESHYRVLAKLLEIGRTDIALTYNTNLSELTFGDHSITDLWSRFENVQIGVSADGMGPIGELVRKGMDWTVFETNLRQVRRDCPHVGITLAVTASVLNIQHLPQFVRYARERLGFGPGDISLKPLQVPEYLSVQILPPDQKRELTVELKRLAEELSSDTTPPRSLANPGWPGGRASVSSLADFMNSNDRRDLLPKFLKHTDRLDKLRKERTVDVIKDLAPTIRLARRLGTPWGKAAFRLHRSVARLSGRA